MSCHRHDPHHFSVGLFRREISQYACSPTHPRVGPSAHTVTVFLRLWSMELSSHSANPQRYSTRSPQFDLLSTSVFILSGRQSLTFSAAYNWVQYEAPTAALNNKASDWYLEFPMDDHLLPLDLTIYGASADTRLERSLPLRPLPVQSGKVYTLPKSERSWFPPQIVSKESQSLQTRWLTSSTSLCLVWDCLPSGWF